MQRCVEDSHRGTGRKSAIEGFRILGKTGSAQIMSLEHHEDFETEEQIPYEFRDHAWYVAAVLDREPKIAMCILVEHGHHGGLAAAPLAKDVIEYFYGKANNAQPVTLAQEVSR
jgi:penicillin-binding protein 2